MFVKGLLNIQGQQSEGDTYYFSVQSRPYSTSSERPRRWAAAKFFGCQSRAAPCGPRGWKPPAQQVGWRPGAASRGPGSGPPPEARSRSELPLEVASRRPGAPGRALSAPGFPRARGGGVGGGTGNEGELPGEPRACPAPPRPRLRASRREGVTGKGHRPNRLQSPSSSESARRGASGPLQRRPEPGEGRGAGTSEASHVTLKGSAHPKRGQYGSRTSASRIYFDPCYPPSARGPGAVAIGTRRALRQQPKGWS